MRDVSEGVKSPAGLPATHAHHDHTLVSRYAADDAYPAERQLAQQLVERCVECAALEVDIRALSATLATSEAPRRPRDFRISAEQAERLHGSAFERFLRRLATPALAPARPLAGVALSIGLALAVAGAALPTSTPSSMSAGLEEAPPGDELPKNQQHGAEEPEIDFEPRVAPGAGEEPVGAESTDAPVFSSDTSSEEGLGQRQTAEAAAADDTRIVLMIAGLTVALLALGTLLMILFARRRMSDPLLR